MDLIEWAMGIAAVIIAGTIIYLGKVLNGLPNIYMPREQIERRFRDLEDRIHDDMAGQDRRNEKHFDRLYNKIDEVLQELKSKADKSDWQPGDPERRR
jgi:hypothetical protein